MIHATAIVHSRAEIADDCEIGPYVVIGEGVSIDSGTSVGSHTVIEGQTRIGKNNRISPHASLGTAPQDIKYKGSPTTLEIGDGNQIREFVTINRGTEGEGGTRLGSNNMIMITSHIAHDCVIGDSCILVTSTLAGHVEVGDHATLGGGTYVYQFVRIGTYAFTGARAWINMDLPPYMAASGQERSWLHGVNAVGLRRSQVPAATRRQLDQAFRALFMEGRSRKEALRKLSEFEQTAEIENLYKFMAAPSKHGVIHWRPSSQRERGSNQLHFTQHLDAGVGGL